MTERRVGLGLALAAILIALLAAGCGGSSEAPTDGATSSAPRSSASSESASYPFDTSGDGDDLLAPEVRRFEFGPEAPLSWRLPAFYAAGETDETSTTIKVGDVRYGIQVVGGTGTTPQARAEEAAGQLDAPDGAVHDVRLGDRDWVAVTDSSDEFTTVVLYGALPGGVVIGAALTATEPLDDVPPERVAELHQTLLSIQLDPAPAS